jgi:hypothetical protein
MADLSNLDYSLLDTPEISERLFHPRPEWHFPAETNPMPITIPVEDQISIGAYFHLAGKTAPNILFFHGNGEIAADYDELGPIYNRMGINFLVVDYRGYGRSGGEPTVSAMMRDCHKVYDFTRKWLIHDDFTGPFIVMGRSLGSASALELASANEDKVDGLAVESGFALTEPLLLLLGIDVRNIGFTENKGFRNLDKIKQFRKPLLIIHAEFDHIIPYSDALLFYDASESKDKTLLKVSGANHNDIFYKGLTEYMSAIKSLANRL